MSLIYPGTEVEGGIIGTINNVVHDFSRPTSSTTTRDIENSIFEIDIYNIAKEAIKEYEYIINNMNSQTYKKNNSDLRKWIIRTYIDSSLTGQPLKGEKLLKSAEENLGRRTSMPKFAKKNYGVTVNQNEVYDKINRTMSLIERDGHSQFFKRLSEGLGLSLTEFYFEWEYDNFERQLIGEKVYPIIEQDLLKNAKINSKRNLYDSIFQTFNNGLDETL